MTAMDTIIDFVCVFIIVTMCTNYEIITRSTQIVTIVMST